MDELRTFKARSIQEAIATVRKELGPEASVLHTRRLPSGVWSWLTSSPRFEVTASATIQAPSRLDVTLDVEAPETAPQTAPEAEPEVLEDQPETIYEDAPRELETDRTPVALQRELPPARRARSSWREMSLRESSGTRPVTGPKKRQSRESHEFALYSKLLDLGFEESLARRLARDASAENENADDATLLQQAAYLAAEQISLAEPWEFQRGECQRIALVGPTGVGKTTTIAKLAADLRLRQKRKVGLITVDTYRIAAVDQLQTYAEIIQLPCEVASSPEEMQSALASLADCEVIFLDTAGRGPFDSLRMHELTRILRSFEADEVHLALSATSRPALLDTLLERFDCARPSHLTLTKLDECDGLGPLAHWLNRSPLPLRFVTTGQDVPQDYAAPTLEILAEAFLARR
jgi:flagellar biosynthesis protein FlhF